MSDVNLPWRSARERSRFLERLTADFEAATSEPLIVTVWGPSTGTPQARLRLGLCRLLTQNGHVVNLSESLPVPGGAEVDLKAWEAIQARNSDLVLLLPDSPGSIAELIYLSDEEIARKTVVFCQEKYRAGYIAVALLSEHASKYGHVEFYPGNASSPRLLLERISSLLRYLSTEKWLRAGDRP